MKRPAQKLSEATQTKYTPAQAMRMAAQRTRESVELKSYHYDVKPPVIMDGVVPKDAVDPLANDAMSPYDYANQIYNGGGFAGFPALAQLATRAEYRAFAAAISTEITRKWIEFTSKEDDGKSSEDKIKLIENEFKRLNVAKVIQTAVQNDCYFGRGQIFLDIKNQDASKPLILDPRTIPIGSFNGILSVEPMWTSPMTYNSINPLAADFYKPSKWYVMGQEVHASRLMTIVTRELPDMLKPAFNFAGMSLSQLAEPYVNNWLRTRQSVADLINNFSTTVLATSMDQVLQGNDDGAGVLARADLFSATRSNKGLMILDKEREELIQINTPLSGLHELQSQAQEQMCSVSRMPAIILTGISPSGLNASSDGEIRVFYDWISAQQNSFWKAPLETILKVVQLSLFGEIDPDIGLNFVSLYEMTSKELSDIRTADSAAAAAYVAMGALKPIEVRRQLANDPQSGFLGIDVDDIKSKYSDDEQNKTVNPSE